MSAQSQLVVFQLGGKRFAVPIASIREIIRYVDPRPVGSPDPAARGVIELRGDVVPIRDPKVELRIEDLPRDDQEGLIMVVDAAAGPSGLLVDAVDSVVQVDGRDLGDPPPDSGRFVSAVVTVDSELLVVVDPLELARRELAAAAA